MSTENISASIKEFVEKKRELDAMLSRLKTEPDTVSAVMASFFGPVFDRYPRLLAFHIQAYTPYFNDGDECTFSTYLSDEGVLVSELGPSGDPSMLLDLNDENLIDSIWTLGEPGCLQEMLKYPQVYLLSNYDPDGYYSTYRESDWYKENAELQAALEAVVADEALEPFLEDHSQYIVYKTVDGEIRGVHRSFDHE